MAVWQVGFHLVPRRVVATPGGLTAEVLRDTDWWATVKFPADYRARLASAAPPAPSTHPNLETWGNEDGDRVDVWSAGGRVTRAMTHVDVRRLDSKFGAAIINLVRIAGAVLVRTDGLVVEPIISAYAGALRSADAWRFSSDPAAFLASHSMSDDENE
jgi:hypothetical protein